MPRLRIGSRIFAALLLIAVLTLAASSSKRKIITPPGTPAGRPYSAGIQFGDTLYVSGQIGTDPKTGKVPDKFEDEVQQCLTNIHGVLQAGGMDYSDVVSVQVYLTDMDLFQRLNAVYTQTFQEPRPTRTAVGVTRLAAPGARLEMTVTARK